MLTQEQVGQQVNLTGNLTHVIEFEFSDLFEFSPKIVNNMDFLGMFLNEKVTGCGGAVLTDITYQIVGARDGKVLIKVSGKIL